MTRWLYLIATGIAVFPTAGCMMGMHGMQHGPSQQMDAPTTIVKEVRNERMAITLTVPPLVRERESVLLIATRDVVTNEPLTDAQVTVMVRSMGDASGHAVPAAPAAEALAVQQDAPGAFRATHTFHNPGTYEFAVAVRLGTEAAAPRVMEFTATQEAGLDEHRAGPSKPWMIAGGAAMVVMMVLRWTVF